MSKDGKKDLKKGGSCSGAAAFAEQVYGAAGSQHADSGSNVIAMNKVSGGSRRRRKTSKKGGKRARKTARKTARK